MNQITEKINEMKTRARAIKEANPDMTTIWFEIKDCAVEDMRELVNEGCRMDYLKERKLLMLNFSSDMIYDKNGNCIWVTVFAYSVPVQPVEHIVDTFAYVNI